MFKSKFKDLMKNDESFEIIKDNEALTVEGGRCGVLTSCTNYKGDCNNLSTCGTYASE